MRPVYDHTDAAGSPMLEPAGADSYYPLPFPRNYRPVWDARRSNRGAETLMRLHTQQGGAIEN